MNSKLNQLTAISPIDGRYYDTTEPLANYFSEFALFKYRVLIELKYLLFLSKIGVASKIKQTERGKIECVITTFSQRDAEQIKEFESITKHDVKAVEYFLRTKIPKHLMQWIHFGLTSYDVNDNAYRLMIKDSLAKVIVPQITNILRSLNTIYKKYAILPMLGRTHGQPAVPTTFGKEIAVFASRIKKDLEKLRKVDLYGKFGGAIGNWNSLNFVFPKKNWRKLSTQFLGDLELKHSVITTQIAPPEDILEIFQCLIRINSILLDFNQDMWRYISDDWIVQKGKEKDVGSSTMPQKVNPIEFENSEGNLIIANGIFETLIRKLPISRLQRDLSDSTVLRNIGVAYAHCLIAYRSCQKGLETIEPNIKKLSRDLNNDWSILSEALQTTLRKNGLADAYEKVAESFRGKKITKEDWIKIIESLKVNSNDKNKLLKLTPEKYIGIVD